MEAGEDFVALEKDVVDKLLYGLFLKLFLGAKRKMLLATPTENAWVCKRPWEISDDSTVLKDGNANISDQNWLERANPPPDEFSVGINPSADVWTLVGRALSK